MNDFFGLLCLCVKVLLCLLNRLYLNPWDFSCFLPHSTKGEWVRGCVGLSCLLGLNYDMAYEIQRFLDELQRRLGHKDSIWNTYNIQVFFCLRLYFLNQSENTLTVKGRNLIWFESSLFLHKTVYPKGWFTLFFFFVSTRPIFLTKAAAIVLFSSHFAWDVLYLTDVNESQSILLKKENTGNFQSSFGKEGPLFKQHVNIEAAIIYLF